MSILNKDIKIFRIISAVTINSTENHKYKNKKRSNALLQSF